MKPTIDYYYQNQPMGDLLNSMGVSIQNDFSDKEIEKLKNDLEHYMSSDGESKMTIDLKKFYLVIKGADEVEYLYQYI